MSGDGPIPAAVHVESALSLLPARKLTVGCPLLDRLLSGGLPCGSLTELAGEAAAGKTQICLQLLLSAFLPSHLGGLSASSLYIHSDLPHSSLLRRLRQLLPFPSPSSNPLDHIFLAAAHSPTDLLALLTRADRLLAFPPSPFPVRLVVVDSIAALFRAEFDNNPAELRRRSVLFFKIAAKLKEQAARFGAVAVVTNQVVDVVGGEQGGANEFLVGNCKPLWSSGRWVCPALGLSWANCVNTRLFLSRSNEIVGQRVSVGDGDSGELGMIVRTRRRMHVVFAPHLPESSCEFEIRKEGVFGVEAER